MRPIGCYLSEPLLGIIGRAPSVSKSNQLQVGIFRSVFIMSRYVP